MPAVNFQKRFAPAVANGKKRQTIRKVRKRPIKKGDKLYLYTGMRTKQCRALKTVCCRRVRLIHLEKLTGEMVSCNIAAIDNGGTRMSLLDIHEQHHLAVRDGFDGFGAMVDWFEKRYGLPFEGVLIEW